MALNVPDAGADAFLNRMLKNVFPAGGANQTLKLFVNNVTPADADVANTYTEASGGNYANVALATSNWTVGTAGGIKEASQNAVTWTFNGALTTNPTIYGYYVIDADGVLLWSEKFSNTFTPANNGDQLSVTPKFQASKGTPT